MVTPDHMEPDLQTGREVRPGMFLTRAPMRGPDVREAYANDGDLHVEFVDGEILRIPLRRIGYLELRPGGWLRVYADRGQAVPFMVQMRPTRVEAEDALDRLRESWEQACGNEDSGPMLALTERRRFLWHRVPRSVELYPTAPSHREMYLAGGCIRVGIDTLVQLRRLRVDVAPAERIIGMQRPGTKGRPQWVVVGNAVMDQRGCVLARHVRMRDRTGLSMRIGDDLAVFLDEDLGRIRVGAQTGWLRKEGTEFALRLPEPIPELVGCWILAIYAWWLQDREDVLPRSLIDMWTEGYEIRMWVRYSPVAIDRIVPAHRRRPRAGSWWLLGVLVSLLGVWWQGGGRENQQYVAWAIAFIVGLGVYEDIECRRLRKWVWLSIPLLAMTGYSVAGGLGWWQFVGLCLTAPLALMLLRFAWLSCSPRRAAALRYQPMVGDADVIRRLTDAPGGEAIY